MSASIPPVREILDLAVRAAQHASADILAAFRNPSLAIDLKADGSVVTSADKEGERRSAHGSPAPTPTRIPCSAKRWGTRPGAQLCAGRSIPSMERSGTPEACRLSAPSSL